MAIGEGDNTTMLVILYSVIIALYVGVAYVVCCK